MTSMARYNGLATNKHSASTKEALDEIVQIIPPFRRVMRVAIDGPDVGNPLFFQIIVHTLADPDQAILIPARQPQQLQLLCR